jgi:hypothetical protein
MTTSFRIACRALSGALRQGRHLLWASLLTFGFIGQVMAEPPLEQTEIRYQGWAGQVTFPELAEDLGYLWSHPKWSAPRRVSAI